MNQHRLSSSRWIIRLVAMALWIPLTCVLESPVTGGEGRRAEVKRILAQAPRSEGQASNEMSAISRTMLGRADLVGHSFI